MDLCDDNCQLRCARAYLELKQSPPDPIILHWFTTLFTVGPYAVEVNIAFLKCHERWCKGQETVTLFLCQTTTDVNLKLLSEHTFQIYLLFKYHYHKIKTKIFFSRLQQTKEGYNCRSLFSFLSFY